MNFRKLFFLTFVILFFMLFFISVQASGFSYEWGNNLSESCSKENVCVPICTYEATRISDIATKEGYEFIKLSSLVDIYYSKSTGSGARLIYNYFFYLGNPKFNDGEFDATEFTNEIAIPYRLDKNDEVGAKTYFRYKDAVENDEKITVGEWLASNFTCPTYVYVNPRAVGEDEDDLPCFDNDGTSCQNYNEYYVRGEKINSDGIIVDAGDVANMRYNYFKTDFNLVKDIMSNYTCDQFRRTNKLLDRMSRDLNKQIISYFIRDYGENLMYNDNYKSHLNSLKSAITNFANTCIEQIENSDLEDNKKQEKIAGYQFTAKELDDAISIGIFKVPGSWEKPEPIDCEDLLSPETQVVLKNILNTAKYIGPVLVVVLTIIDLIKAAVTGDDEQMKKIKGKFIKRIISAVLLFFIPILINVFFDIFGITSADCSAIAFINIINMVG